MAKVPYMIFQIKIDQLAKDRLTMGNSLENNVFFTNSISTFIKEKLWMAN